MLSDNPGMIVDIVLGITLLGAFVGGWRQGALTSVLSTVGVIGGLFLGATAAPWLMGYTESTAFRFLLAAGSVLLLIGLGNVLGGLLGGRLRQGIRTKVAHRIDSVIGSIFQVITTLVVAWLLAIPLATAGPSQLADGLKDSSILRQVDKAIPAPIRDLPNAIAAMLSDSGLPPLLSPFQEKGSVEVAAPLIEVSNREAVERLRPSVIHINGQAQKCRHLLSGSGFVFAPDYVLTNAHVVAGTETVKLDTVLGVREATVVLYNPEVDVAVLHAPGLGIDPMTWAAESAESGSDAIVMGYPGSGPFTATPARIREKILINGPDIYAENRLDREAYTLRGNVRQGNSGGPLTNNDGQLIGMIFGAAADDTDTGYALTKDEVLRTIGDYVTLTEAVDTRECVLK